MADEAPDDEPLDDASPTVGPGTVNVADPTSTKRGRRRARREEDRRTHFWQTVFSDPLGRREMWTLLNEGGAFEQRFGHTPNGMPVPEETQRQEGEHRLAFKFYLWWLGMAPEGVALMLSENHPALVGQKPQRGDRS